MFILCLDVSLLFLPLGWSPNLSLFFAWTPEAVAIWFGSSPAPTTQCWRHVPAQRWFLVTRMRWHYAMLGPQWCRYGSIPLHTSTIFFWMNIQNCNLFLVWTEGVRRVPGFCPTAVRMFFCWWLVYSWLVGELLPYTWLFGGSWISMVVIFTVGWAQRHPQRMSPQGLLRADTCSSIAIESRKGTIFVMYTTKWPVGTTQILMFFDIFTTETTCCFSLFLKPMISYGPMGVNISKPSLKSVNNLHVSPVPRHT